MDQMSRFVLMNARHRNFEDNKDSTVSNIIMQQTVSVSVI